ncbi:hypothetical protein NMG60_11004363 [Bertholletia excelsa]
MVSDSIANASIPMAASNPKDFAKKKRANRSAKLKQCKLDARREQWLSQVKNKGCKGETEAGGECCPQVIFEHNESNRSVENLEAKQEGKRSEGSVHHFSDSESPSSSPTSITSSDVGSNVSGTSFTGSSSGSSGGSCSGSVIGEEDEGVDGCLDDWEAVADALAAADEKLEHHDPCSEPAIEVGSIDPLDVPAESPPELSHRSALGTEVPMRERDLVGKVQRAQPTCRAWKPDDVFRPQSLPNLSKQLSFPVSRRYGSGGGVPYSCPICCEDLDLTDSSFLPCSCGFRLCLFCHKRILEESGRCPGCRKQYDHVPVEGEATIHGGSLTFRLARSCSMITRS